MQDTVTPNLAAGTRLAHYEVRSLLGAGGMGTVYLAHDTALDRPVALKVLRSEVAGDPALAERFVREARAAARVSHPNLTHVYFVGKSGDLPFFAMEYCPGQTLEALVKEKGPLPLERGLSVLVQAARGLAAAHGASVVHRDVKPSNLMVLPDGTVKVADFGLAKSLGGDVQATAGRLMGTPTYMSPEQARGKEVGERTDIYLLGLTAYFLFAGRPAFSSDSIGEVINDQINTPLPDVGAERPDLPAGVAELLARMCAKDPAKRPASMAEVAAAAEALRPRLLLSAPIFGRVFAASFDALVYVVAFAGAVLLGGLALGYVPVEFPGKETIVDGLRSAVGLALAFLFFPLAEVRYGTSLGKHLFHFRVVRADGGRLRWREAVARLFLRFPFIALLFLTFLPDDTWPGIILSMAQGAAVVAGVLWYFFADGRTLSDVLTKTRVVHQGAGVASRAP